MLSYNRTRLQLKSTEAVSNRDLQTFAEYDVGSDETDPMIMDEEQPEHSVSSYEKRRRREADHWESLQDDLTKTYIEVSAMKPCNQYCIKCIEDGRPYMLATMRCSDCGLNQFYCSDCAESLHKTRNFFHIVEVWKVSNLFEKYNKLLGLVNGQA